MLVTVVIFLGLLICYLWFRRDVVAWEPAQNSQNDCNAVTWKRHPSRKRRRTAEAIDTLLAIGKLPVWISSDANEASPDLLEEIFEDITSSGDYLYYLAGDYQKNETGFLQYASVNTRFLVTVTFESERIAALREKEGCEQQRAGNRVNASAELLDSSVIDVLANFAPIQTNVWESYLLLSTLNDELPESAQGNARLMLIKRRVDGPYQGVKILYSEFRAPQTEGERERQVQIESASFDKNMRLDALLEHFLILVNTYQSMPYFEANVDEKSLN